MAKNQYSTDSNVATENMTPDEINERIEDAVTRIRAFKEQIEQLDVCITELKVELHDLLKEKGENWADDAGYARLVSEGERISYDVRALDELLIEDPLRYGWLKEYRYKSPIQGRVQVK